MNKEVEGILVTNPDAIDSVADLRSELHEANERIRRFADAVKHQNVVGSELAGLVNAVLSQHLRGDHRGVAAILDQQLNASQKLREMIEEANESCEIEQTVQWEAAANNIAQAEPMPPYNCEGTDPWATKNTLELQKALDSANRAGVRAVADICTLKQIVDDMAAEMSKIVVAHLRGDQEALNRAVASFCEQRVIVKSDDKATKVH